MHSEFKRLFWMLVGMLIGYMVAQLLLHPETPKHEAKTLEPNFKRAILQPQADNKHAG